MHNGRSSHAEAAKLCSPSQKQRLLKTSNGMYCSPPSSYNEIYSWHVYGVNILSWKLLLSSLPCHHKVHIYDALHGVLTIHGTSTLAHFEIGFFSNQYSISLQTFLALCSTLYTITFVSTHVTFAHSYSQYDIFN
jgi:hypothetical protein